MTISTFLERRRGWVDAWAQRETVYHRCLRVRLLLAMPQPIVDLP